MSRERGLVVLLIAACCALAPGVAAAQDIGFETPTIVDPLRTFGEPDVGVDAQGRVFSSGPTGTGTQRSVWYGSVDGGHTFRGITPGPPPDAIQSFNAPPGGGDTDIAFARDGTQFFTDLYALTCLRVAVTPDGGKTVSQNVFPGGCAGVPAADRQWLAVYDPAPGTPNQSPYTGPKPLVYQEYNNVSNGAQWTKSTDGLNYTNAQTGAPGYNPFGADGYPAIDQVTGKVFQAETQAVSGQDGKWSLLLNIGTPNADGDLTFLDDGAQGDPTKLIHVADNLPGGDDVLFPVASMDAARNLYVAWVVDDPSDDQSKPQQRQVFVSASSAASGWKTWTPALQVSDGSPATGDAVNIMPWIQAGGSGRADAVWYGQNKLANPSKKAGQAWNVFMAALVFPTGADGAITGAAPTVKLAKVSPHPMHYDDVCLQGTGCITAQGNRNLADFFQIKMDRTGAAEIVYDDTSNGLAQPGFTPGSAEVLDHSGAPVVTIARQSSGPGLLGPDVTGPSNTPVRTQADPAGDALFPVIGGTNVAGYDVLGEDLSLSGDTLTVKLKVADLSDPAGTLGAIQGASYLQYVTRWQMGNKIYYAEMERQASGEPSFYAGQAQSIDLCSVSACFPHVITYPEAGSTGGNAEKGSVSCPAKPSASAPCTITIQAKAADVGSPKAGTASTASLLESLGSYAFASSHRQADLTNAQAQADNVPLQVDGVCCINFREASASSVLPKKVKHKAKHKKKRKARKHKRHRRSATLRRNPRFTG